jgi:hypothetical protein
MSSNDEILNECEDEEEANLRKLSAENASIAQSELSFGDVTIEHVCTLPGELKDNFKEKFLPLFSIPQFNQTLFNNVYEDLIMQNSSRISFTLLLFGEITQTRKRTSNRAMR